MSPRGRPPLRRPRGRPPDPGPPRTEARAHHPPRQPPPKAPEARPKKIVFEDELPARAPRKATRPPERGPEKPLLKPPPVPDYELRYPAIHSARARSRYAAVFQDQYPEFLKLQRDVGRAQAKLQRLEALLSALPAPGNQEEAQTTARLWRELEKKRMDPRFLDKQARCRYLKEKLTHLKTQMQTFDDQEGSEGSVYF